MTGTDVITNRARVILDDTVPGATERWADAVLLVWLNDGQRLVSDFKPEALLATAYTETAYADAATVGATLVLPDRYRSALVVFVVSMALAQDSQDERDLTRARSYYNQFVTAAGLSLAAPEIRGRRP